jgi:hypothetical protein
MFYMSNFKINETELVVSNKQKLEVNHPKIYRYSLGEGQVITGSIILTCLVIFFGILRIVSKEKFNLVKETARKKIFWSPILRS